jgi:opacity protein-like surface antigen
MFRFCSRACVWVVVTGIGLLAASDAVGQAPQRGPLPLETPGYDEMLVELVGAYALPCLDADVKTALLARATRVIRAKERTRYGVSDNFIIHMQIVERKPTCGSDGLSIGIEAPMAQPPSFFFGVEGVANFNSLSIREQDATSGVTRNTFSESSRAGGGGLIIGANTNIFLPDNASPRPVERILISFDFFNQDTSHVFPTSPTTFIGATSKFMVTGEVHLGVNVVPGVQIYGIGGFTVLNQDLNINFGGPFVTMQNNTTIGPTYGAGLSFQLPGSPVTSFVQWEQTPFATASLPRPPASSSFNYDFTNTMNRLKVGVTVPLRGHSSDELMVAPFKLFRDFIP